ncbi:MAG: hypothetical protein M3Y87_11430 [Myxococcota bacterium]|nr:hypothetical protein [Myxococcota bacterium]
MTNKASALAALCACAMMGCGGSDATEGRAATAEASGGERVASRPVVPDLAEPEPEIAYDISALRRTGTGIVHDRDDATAESPLPSMADPLDLREPVMPVEGVSVQLCPAGLAGLQARAVDTERGPALELTAQGEEAIDDLRARMQRFASALSQREGDVPDVGGLLSADDVRYVVIPGGARLEAQISDPARVEEVRRELNDDAMTLGEGRCPLSLQVEA